MNIFAQKKRHDALCLHPVKDSEVLRAVDTEPDGSGSTACLVLDKKTGVSCRAQNVARDKPPTLLARFDGNASDERPNGVAYVIGANPPKRGNRVSLQCLEELVDVGTVHNWVFR